MNSLKEFDFKLWFTFLLIILIPSLQNIIRLHFIGDMPNEWGFNIASQIQWLNILYEILKEGILLPLFFMLYQAKRKGYLTLRNSALSGLYVVFLFHCILSLCIFFFANELLSFAKQTKELIAQTSTYIKIESVAILFSISLEYLIIYLAVSNKIKEIFKLFLFKSILLFFSDLFIISQNDYSLKLGVNGIAISNLIINILLSIYIISKINFHELIINKEFTFNKNWIKSWFKLGFFSGAESLVRNAVFFIMILSMMNEIGEQGNYWVANSIIWGILLAPSLALSEVVKRDIAESVENIKIKTHSYIMLTLLFSIFWILTLPFLDLIMPLILGNKNNIVIDLIILQTIFYLCFMFNNSIFDATIYGLGITKYIFYQSIFVNIGYYGAIFILYKTEVIVMSLYSISMIFGFGMLIDLFPTLYFYIKALKQNNIKLNEIFSKKFIS
ncbi:hypothetical protein K7G90_001784 [Pasteurella canis]|uniref:MATE family Na+-driven efflux transporter n=1 Tax=Pasteurella canis TaxID=753 RepID=UPI001CC7BADA|nr:MATE family Na+-driven efflux transporter [Pasteurella canis]UAY77523.1 hypothetical protein K7G90_001784 [Pasteurella canis]